MRRFVIPYLAYNEETRKLIADASGPSRHHVGLWVRVSIHPDAVEVAEGYPPDACLDKVSLNERVALVIVLISGISYLGFTSGQLLAGGTFTLVALIKGFEMLYGLDASFYGILLSGAEFISLSLLFSDREKLEAPEEAVL